MGGGWCDFLNIFSYTSRVNELKTYLRTLHNFLLFSNDFEKGLGKKVKTMTQDIINQRIEIDRASAKQFTDNTTIGELKRELMKVRC